MWKWIIEFLGGGILKTASETFIKYKDSQNEAERIKADVAKKQLDNHLETQKIAERVRLATSAYVEQRVIAAVLGGSVALHWAAVWLDTVFRFGWGIPSAPGIFEQWEGTIVGSYFGVQLTLGIARMATAAVVMGRR